MFSESIVGPSGSLLSSHEHNKLSNSGACCMEGWRLSVRALLGDGMWLLSSFRWVVRTPSPLVRLTWSTCTSLYVLVKVNKLYSKSPKRRGVMVVELLKPFTLFFTQDVKIQKWWTCGEIWLLLMEKE